MRRYWPLLFWLSILVPHPLPVPLVLLVTLLPQSGRVVEPSEDPCGLAFTSPSLKPAELLLEDIGCQQPQELELPKLELSRALCRSGWAAGRRACQGFMSDCEEEGEEGALRSVE